MHTDMSRYLFRGKRLMDNRWVVGYFMMSEPTQFTKRTRPVIVDMDSGIAEYVKTIGQSTGLKDSRDKLIFEGDIIRYRYRDYFSPEEPDGTENDWTISAVSWHGERSYPAFDISSHDDHFEANGLSTLLLSDDVFFEVIGNIHDSPELLENGGKDE